MSAGQAAAAAEDAMPKPRCKQGSKKKAKVCTVYRLVLSDFICFELCSILGCFVLFFIPFQALYSRRCWARGKKQAKVCTIFKRYFLDVFCCGLFTFWSFVVL